VEDGALVEAGDGSLLVFLCERFGLTGSDAPEGSGEAGGGGGFASLYPRLAKSLSTCFRAIAGSIFPFSMRSRSNWPRLLSFRKLFHSAGGWEITMISGSISESCLDWGFLS
jgi:hypothetical protein